MTAAQRDRAARMRRISAELRLRADSIRRSVIGFRRERNKKLRRARRTREILRQVGLRGAL
mgnify:CR=1 FL=1